MTVTDVPPAIGPPVGEIEVTVGRQEISEWSAPEVAEVPPGVFALMSTRRSPAGEVAVIVVALTT